MRQPIREGKTLIKRSFDQLPHIKRCLILICQTSLTGFSVFSQLLNSGSYHNNKIIYDLKPLGNNVW
jgi:hypothetical protein